MKMKYHLPDWEHGCKKIRGEMYTRVRELYKEGYSARDIAKLFDGIVTERTIKNYVKGITKKIGRPSKELKESLKLLKYERRKR